MGKNMDMGRFIKSVSANLSKWNIYQNERFPVKQYIPLVGAFSFCAVSYSSMLRGEILSFQAFAAAFITSLAFFMLLRIADEFKDYEEDLTYRPYRPVQRGIISLKELGTAGAGLILLQLLTAWIYNRYLIPILILVLIYFGIMTKEFFAKEWLKKRPLVYLISHMLIMPLIDFYATACDWITAAGSKHSYNVLGWFLAASFFNGAVIEIGRKIRTKENEEKGVETYTVLWGSRKAVGSWLAVMGGAFICAVAAGAAIHIEIYVIVLLVAVYSLSAYNGLQFIKMPTAKKAKRFEIFSGIWTLFMYLSLGLVPIILKIFG